MRTSRGGAPLPCRSARPRPQVSIRYASTGPDTATMYLRINSSSGPIIARWGLPKTMGGDQSSVIYRGVFKEASTGLADPNQSLTVDLGSKVTVGSIVLQAPSSAYCPRGLKVFFRSECLQWARALSAMGLRHHLATVRAAAHGISA